MLSTIAPLALLAGLVAPSDSAPGPSGSARYSLFGLDVCIGAPADAPSCDVRLPAPPPSEPPTPKPTPGVLTVFGKTLCSPRAPQDVRCDFRLAEPAPTTRGA
jgi:hypothetical protein